MNKHRKFALISSLMSLLLLPITTNVYAADDSESGNDPLDSGIFWSASAGAGFDNNVFRAPDSFYIDYASPNPNPPTPTRPITDSGYDEITPNVQSGVYIPIALDGEIIKKLSPDNYMSSRYKFDGRFYLDSDLTDANINKHTIQLGNTHISSQVGSRENTLYTGLVIAHKNALYLDRDTGDHQEYLNEDISERYTYDMLGTEVKFKNRVDKLKYTLQAKYNQKSYVVTRATAYDHTYYLLGADVKFRLPLKHDLTLSYKYWAYDYDLRKARSGQDATLGKLNGPPRKYVYNNIGATVRKRLSKNWLAYVDYEWTQRVDKFEGYDDYTKNIIKTRIHYKWNENNKLKITFYIWDRSYPNAVAFDKIIPNVIDRSKHYDGLGLKIDSTTRMSKSESIIAEVKYTDENSTDDRYEYDRLETSISYRWESK